MFWSRKNRDAKTGKPDKYPLRNEREQTEHSPHRLSEPEAAYEPGREGFYQSLLENLSEVAFEMEADGRIIYLSPAVTKMLGFQPDALLGSHLEHWIHPEDKGVFHLMMRDLQREPYAKFEYRIQNKEGGFQWVRSSLTPVYEKASIIRARGCLVDIQERKSAEEEIRLSEAKFRALFDYSPDAYLLQVEDIFVEVNPAAAGLFGTDRSFLIGKTPVDISPEFQPDGSRSSEKAEQIIQKATREKSIRFEWEHLRKDGTPLFVSVSLSCLEAGDKHLYFASWRDISESREIQRKLETSEERFRALANLSGFLVWEVDLEGRFTYNNEAVKSVLGYAPEELIGKKYFYDLQPEAMREEYKAKGLELLQSGKEIREHINPAFNRDGSIRWLNTSGMPVKDEKGQLTGYRGADKDITEELEMRKALERQNKKLNAIINAIPDLLFVIDRDGIIRDYHIQEKGVTYVPEEEIIGTDLRSIFDEKTAGEQFALIQRCLERESRFDYTYSMLISGETNWFEARFLPWEEDRVMAFVRKLGGPGRV
jgi:PAS domain S-box-containing protein